jgi:hypothetical protein
LPNRAGGFTLIPHLFSVNVSRLNTTLTMTFYTLNLATILATLGEVYIRRFGPLIKVAVGK